MSEVRFDRESVRRLLRLARLEADTVDIVSDAELDVLARDLANIEESIRQLQQVDVQGVEPWSVAESTRARPDEVGEALSPEDAVAGAEEHDGPYFVVPRVVD